MTRCFQLTLPSIPRPDSQRHPPQPKGVSDDGHRTERHRRARDHRAEQQPKPGVQDACRNRNTCHVVDERKEQVLPDVLHRRATEAARPHDAAQVPFDQGDTGALHRHVCPGAHRDAHVCLRQSRRIVDAVSGHRHALTALLQPLDDRRLLFRQDVGFNLIDLDGFRDGLRGRAVVASEHHHLYAFPVQGLDGLVRGGLDRIGHADEPRQLSIDRNEHDRLALAAQLLRSRSKRRGLDAERLEVLQVSDGYRESFDGAGHAFARGRREVRDLGQADLSLVRASDNRGCERMLADMFETRGQTQQGVGVDPWLGLDRHQLWRPLRERAGLVHDDGGHLFEDLERLGVANEPATLGAPAGADHNRHGGCQAERAGTRDDQNGNRIHEGVHQPRLRPVQLEAWLRPNPTASFTQQTEPAGTDAQSRIDVEWPLDLFRRTGRVNVADRELEATERATTDRERLLISDVRMKFGEVLTAVRELSVADELIATTERQQTLIAARAEAGATPPLERDILRVELQRLEAEQILQAGHAEHALIELKRLLGLAADAPLTLKEDLEQLVRRETSAVMSGVPASVSTRADVAETESRVRLADAQIDRARRDGRVDLSVFGMYMRSDAGFPQRAFSPQNDLERVRGVFHYVSGGIMVSVPLRDRNQGEVASAQARLTGARAQLDATRLTAQAKVATARARDEHARRALAIYSADTRSLAKQNLDVVSQTYALGRMTLFDVLTERRRYLETERAYTTVLKEAYEARQALRRALGEVR